MTQTFTVEQRIRTGVATLANSAGWASLAHLRIALADIDRAEMDATLRQMSRSGRAVLAPYANQKAMTPADRDAAIRIGNTQCHMIAIDR